MVVKKDSVKKDESPKSEPAKVDAHDESKGEMQDLEERADSRASRELSPEEQDKEARKAMSSRRNTDSLIKTEEGVKAYVNVGNEDVLTLEIGGTTYEFRKGYPVHLPPGQSLDHPDIEEVK